jgi:hypothetical protein
MLSFFEEAEHLCSPNQYRVANFCATTFRQLRSDPLCSAVVTGMAHYKEEVGQILDFSDL